MDFKIDDESWMADIEKAVFAATGEPRCDGEKAWGAKLIRAAYMAGRRTERFDVLCEKNGGALNLPSFTSSEAMGDEDYPFDKYA